MAGFHSRATMAIGSSPWISAERGMATQFIAQDMEDFAFSARNEMDWLNEHMVDVFSNDQMNVADMLKTPGKLRGKTPRTVRKRNALENRAPLTDIFTSNNQASPISTAAPQPSRPAVTFKVAEDLIEQEPSRPPKRAPKHPKENFDSGYHGTTEDEMEIDSVSHTQQPPKPQTENAPSRQNITAVGDAGDDNMDFDPTNTREQTTEASFHSAEETLAQPASTTHGLFEPVETTKSTSSPRNQPSQITPVAEVPEDSPLEAVADDDVGDAASAGASPEAPTKETEAHSPSDASSPVQPLLRKSSLNFASLPAREPLATKKSLGTRNSRTSHLEQSKANGSNGSSYLGRHTGGKSIGSYPQDDSDQSDRDEEEREPPKAPGIKGDESDGESKTTKLHNKTSTQRLQGKINMLAQSQPPRSNRLISSINAAKGELKYPDLSSVAASHPSSTTTHAEGQKQKGPEDEDDWIPSQPSRLSAPAHRPQLAKSHSADVMEQISGKESIGGIGTENSTVKPDELPASPAKPSARGLSQNAAATHTKSISTSIIGSPARIPGGFQRGLSKQASVSNPNLAAHVSGVDEESSSTTPAGSPAGKRYADGPLSASKAKLSSLLKSARGIFASSAGVSAQGKMEAMSPSSYRTHPRQDAQSNRGPSTIEPAPPQPFAAPQQSETRPLPEPPKVRETPVTQTKEVSRKTRSSSEKEAKNREKESQEREKTEQELEEAREKERQKPNVYQLEKERVAAEEKRRNAAKQQPKASAGTDPAQPLRADPKRTKADEPAQKPEVKATPYDTNIEEQQSQSNTTQSRAQTSQFAQSQKTKEPRRPFKPGKDTLPKVRPAPVAIRVDTVSQWGLDHRKIAQGSTNAPAPAQQQEAAASSAPAAGKPPGLQKKASTNSLQSSTSNNGSKFSISTTGGRPKALLAAERKKEQDEREAQRKLESKREMERKRATQQEEERRQEQQQRKEAERQRTEERAAAAEEQRKAAQRQAMDKRRLELAKKAEQAKPQPQPGRFKSNNDTTQSQTEKPQASAAPQRGELGNARPPSRLNTAPNSRFAQEELNKPVKQPHINPAKPPKRALQTETLDDQAGRPANKGGMPYQPNEHKRRKTDEEDIELVDARQAMPPPPIRRSNMNGGPSKPMFSNGYASASHAPNTHTTPSFFNPSNTASTYTQPSKAPHPMAMATYSSQKIPFADAQGNKAAPPPQAHRTPANKAAVTAPKSSPRYPNGDLIELPEIATDSEDEDDENDFVVPDWAKSPNLDPSLLGQELWNPEEVFGPPNPTLHVEEIFTSKDRHHRFRARTSSANWNGQDRLTQDEIDKDIEARQKLIANGGWTYGL